MGFHVAPRDRAGWGCPTLQGADETGHTAAHLLGWSRATQAGFVRPSRDFDISHHRDGAPVATVRPSIEPLAHARTLFPSCAHTSAESREHKNSPIAPGPWYILYSFPRYTARSEMQLFPPGDATMPATEWRNQGKT